MSGDVADFWDLQSLNLAKIFSMPFNNTKSFQIPIENYGEKWHAYFIFSYTNFTYLILFS